MKTFGISLGFMSAIFMGGILLAIPLIAILNGPIHASGIFPVPIGLMSVPFYLVVSPGLSLFWAIRNPSPTFKSVAIRTLPMALIGGALLATLVISGAWVT